MGPRAWEACDRYVPSHQGRAWAGLRFPEPVPRLGWGIPSPGLGSQGAAEMSLCWLNKAALSRGLISGAVRWDSVEPGGSQPASLDRAPPTPAKEGQGRVVRRG